MHIKTIVYMLIIVLTIVFYTPFHVLAETNVSTNIKPVFTFAHITDTHIIDTDSVKNSNYPYSTQNFQHFTELINSEKNHKLPDFVIISGDLADRGDKKSFVKFLQLTKEINCPVYFVGGNHDVMQWRGSNNLNWDKTYYSQILGTQTWCQDFTYKNAVVILATLRRRDGDDTVAWIEDRLKTYPSSFTIVATHFPVYPARKNYGGMAINEFIGGIGIDLQKVLDRYSRDRVILYLTGHTHINSLTRKSNVYNVTTSALAGGRYPGYRYFEVYDDSVKSKFYSVDTTTSSMVINPSKPCDEYHQSWDENVCGNEVERDFEISTIPEKGFYKTVSYQLLFEGIPVPPAWWLQAINIFPSTKTVIVDGKFDDPVWKSTNAVSFRYFRDNQNKPLPFGTTAYAAYDTNNLYFFIQCHEPDISTMTAVLTKRDDKIWLDDSVDIYLAPANQQMQYFHLIVNPLNTQYDETCYNSGRTRSAVWDGEWYSAVDKGSDYWNVEIRIPLKTIGSSSPIGFNVSRRRIAGGYQVSFTGTQKSLHQPQKFVSLLLMK